MYITQHIAELIKSRLKGLNISMKKMLTDLKMGINTISEFSKGKEMSCISLAKIADYLDCSVDYLLGRTDIPEVNRGEVYDEEERLIAAPKITPAEITFDDDETDIT